MSSLETPIAFLKPATERNVILLIEEFFKMNEINECAESKGVCGSFGKGWGNLTGWSSPPPTY
jgi:hypothetical protein